MDRTTFIEAVLADFISRVSVLPREELLQELIELKSLVLESASDSEVLETHHGNRHFED